MGSGSWQWKCAALFVSVDTGMIPVPPSGAASNPSPHEWNVFYGLSLDLCCYTMNHSGPAVDADKALIDEGFVVTD